MAINRDLINAKIPMPDLLNRLGNGHQYSYIGNCFCPFHDNTVSPAAKIFHDETGDSLYCFAEMRSYKPYDALKLLIDLRLIGASLDVISERLEAKYGVDFKIEYNRKSVYTDKFKKGEMSFNDYLLFVKETLSNK